MTTGQRIKARRKELHINADALAEMLEVSRSTIFRYENGDIEKLPIDILKPIAKALRTTPEYLMGWDEALDPNISLTAKQKIMVEKITKMNSNELDFADRVFDSVLELRNKQQE